MVVTDRILEIVRTTEIVFRTGSADRRIITVIVQIELDFTFAPPAAVIHAPGHIGADIVPHAFHAVQNRVYFLIGKRIYTAELGVEISAVFRDILQFIVYLIVIGDGLFGAVLERNAAFFAKRHLPVTVKCASGVHANGQRGELCIFIPAGGEEITYGTLYGRLPVAVPVKPDDRIAPFSGWRHPDMVDHAGAGYMGNLKGFSGRDDNVGVYFPAGAKIAGCRPGGSVLQRTHAAFPGIAREMFRTDRAGAGIGKTG